MFRRACFTVFFTCAIVVDASLVAAQQPPPAGDAAPGRSGRAARGGDPADPAFLPEAQLAAMLDTYAIVQAQTQLGIPDDKYGAFAARLKKLQDVRRKNLRVRRQIVQELRRLAGPKAPAESDDTAIRKQIVALREHDERAAAELRQAYEALDEVLDARQQARFRIFEEHIEQRKLDLLVRARERARLNRQLSQR